MALFLSIYILVCHNPLKIGPLIYQKSQGIQCPQAKGCQRNIAEMIENVVIKIWLDSILHIRQKTVIPTQIAKFMGPTWDMGPTWVLSTPDGPHVGPRNLAIRISLSCLQVNLGSVLRRSWPRAYPTFKVNDSPLKLKHHNCNNIIHIPLKSMFYITLLHT